MNTSEPNRDLQHTRVIHNKLILQALISQKRQSLLWVAESPLRVAERPTGGKNKPKNALNSGSFAFRATKRRPRESVLKKKRVRTLSTSICSASRIDGQYFLIWLAHFFRFPGSRHKFSGSDSTREQFWILSDANIIQDIVIQIQSFVT